MPTHTPPDVPAAAAPGDRAWFKRPWGAIVN
jgi:hypothetical protein